MVNLPQGKELLLPIEWRLDEPKNWSRHLGKEKSLAAAGI